MLYERWRKVCRATPDRLAIWDGADGRHCTFAELAQAAERQTLRDHPVHCARGSGPEFILSVLAAWRFGQILVPLESGQAEPTPARWPAGDIAHLKTTSATGGVSRLIAFTAEQLAADCENVVSSMGLTADLPNVAAISLAHSYGFSNLVLPLLLKGIPLLIAGSALPESVRAAMERAPEVALPSVPALWQAWQEAGILSDRIRIAISAGAPLPLDLERQVFESSGVKIHNFYGSSECGGIAYDRTSVPRSEAAVAGTPMHGVDVRLNGEGCVTVQSRAVGASYWPEAEATLSNGVFESGDLGEITNGIVYLRGRACDRINVAGRKVIPEDVERALARHPAVRDCLVFGVPSDDIRNETIVACVCAGEGVSTRQLSEFLRKRLPAWQVPRHWWMLESLAVNERGKRSRSRWRSRYLDERGSAS
jgi:acyl-CoA synthetase (AMP-forming)/AMP-acid ligase II